VAYSRRDAPNCDWCPYKKNCLYDLLGDKDAKKAWREMRLANAFKRGEVIFHEGSLPQGVYVVCTGKVKRKWEENGERLAELTIWTENAEGKQTTPGEAVVVFTT